MDRQPLISGTLQAKMILQSSGLEAWKWKDWQDWVTIMAFSEHTSKKKDYLGSYGMQWVTQRDLKLLWRWKRSVSLKKLKDRDWVLRVASEKERMQRGHWSSQLGINPAWGRMTRLIMWYQRLGELWGSPDRTSEGDILYLLCPGLGLQEKFLLSRSYSSRMWYVRINAGQCVVSIWGGSD